MDSNEFNDCYVNYSSLVWAQNLDSIKRFFVYKRNPYGLYIFEVIMLTHLLYSENPTK